MSKVTKTKKCKHEWKNVRNYEGTLYRGNPEMAAFILFCKWCAAHKRVVIILPDRNIDDE